MHANVHPVSLLSSTRVCAAGCRIVWNARDRCNGRSRQRRPHSAHRTRMSALGTCHTITLPAETNPRTSIVHQPRSALENSAGRAAGLTRPGQHNHNVQQHAHQIPDGDHSVPPRCDLCAGRCSERFCGLHALPAASSTTQLCCRQCFQAWCFELVRHLQRLSGSCRVRAGGGRRSAGAAAAGPHPPLRDGAAPRGRRAAARQLRGRCRPGSCHGTGGQPLPQHVRPRYPPLCAATAVAHANCMRTSSWAHHGSR
jgi:hypothetical protein